MTHEETTDDLKSLSSEGMAAISGLVTEKINIENEIMGFEAQLKEAKAQLKALDEESIPSCMDEMGFDSLRLTSGASLTIKPFVQCSILKDNRDGAQEWLDEQGHGGIVKHEVVVPLPRGNEGDALATLILAVVYEASNITGQAKHSVHHSTLKAWAREMMENGSSIPDDFFSVFTGRKAYLK